MTNLRIGHGYDVHRLTEGRALILGGVTIPYEKGLLGHSDADVLTHAVMDALLGAAALGDIGKLFPDSAGEFAGISSLELLRQVKRELPEKSIWAFSGYLFDRDILSGRLGDTREYLSYLDVLVDGPFVEAKKNLSLRFRGSENQRLIDVPASLASGNVVLWTDWQGEGRGMK